MHRLLIVDDEDSIRFSLSSYFESHGFVTDCASNIEQVENLVENGTYTEFLNWFGKPGPSGTLFGRLYNITNPVVGNHEYLTANATGYFKYWNNIPAYYSYDAAGWHFIALNSTEESGQSNPAHPNYQAQRQWLAPLPPDYVDDMRLKIDLYRRLTRVSRHEELDDFRSELIDRFGEPPRPVDRLLELTGLKMDAASWRISAIYIEGEFVVFKYDDRQRIEQLARLHKGKLRIVDERSAYLPLPHNLAETDRIWRIVKSVLRPPQQATTIPPRASVKAL